MARKNGIRSENSGTIHFDTRTKAVMAEVSLAQENIKEKVNAVREVILGKSNNEIILVLQYYEYDVSKAIQAYFDDGAQKALTEWHWSGNKAPNKKRKNKKKSQQKNSGEETDIAPGKDVSTPPLQNGLPVKENIPNGIIVNGSESSKLLELCVASEPTGGGHTTEIQIPEDTQLSTANSSKSAAEPSLLPQSSSKQTSQSSNKRTSPSPSKETSPSISNQPSTKPSLSPPSTAQPQRQQPHHLHHRQRTTSGSHSHRQRSGSERSTSSTSENKPVHYKVHAGLEKSVKDLHRQTVSLERFRLVLNEEVEKTYKRMKSVFEEMRTCLNEREADLMTEMDNVKLAANDIFAKRQKTATELKVKVDRSDRMKEQELAELRADIKHFVSDRKVDEDLCRTTRFLYDSDHLKEEISQFAEVVPVKCTYSVRRPSISSVASSGPEESESLTSSINSSTSVPVETNSQSLDISDAHEIAELQRRLKGSLQVQGYMKTERASAPSVRPDQSSNDHNNTGNDSSSQEALRYTPKNPSEQSDKTQQNSPIKAESSEPARRPQYGSYSGRGRGRGGNYRGSGRPRSPRKDGDSFYYKQGSYEKSNYQRRDEYRNSNSRRGYDRRNFKPREDNYRNHNPREDKPVKVNEEKTSRKPVNNVETKSQA